MNGGWIIRYNGLKSPSDISSEVLRRINEHPCPNASNDHPACAELLSRLEHAARRGGDVTYASLVRDVSFSLQNPNGSTRLHKIDTDFLRHSDEDLIHEYTRYLGAASYRDHAVLLNALVVPSERQRYPSERFFKWFDAIKGRQYYESDLSHRNLWEQEVTALVRTYSTIAA